MNKEELEKDGLMSIKEFETAWTEFFKDKPEPKSEEEDKRQQEAFHHWYNYERKQSDTGKTPAEMHKEIYGEYPKNIIDEKKPSRFMNFEWDEDYDEDIFDEQDEEESLKETTELADHMFDNGVWQNSKEEMKEMSKRDSSRHMFRLGVFMHSQYVNEQMKALTNELESMPKENVQKFIDSFNDKKNERKMQDLPKGI